LIFFNTLKQIFAKKFFEKAAATTATIIITTIMNDLFIGLSTFFRFVLLQNYSGGGEEREKK
jgi:hypothetical protein